MGLPRVWRTVIPQMSVGNLEVGLQPYFLKVAAFTDTVKESNCLPSSVGHKLQKSSLQDRDKSEEVVKMDQLNLTVKVFSLNFPGSLLTAVCRIQVGSFNNTVKVWSVYLLHNSLIFSI